MGSLVETFHLDLRLLIAQMINFAIVIGILYFFAVKPIVQIMQDRTKKIEKSLEDAKKIDAKMLALKEEYRGTVNNAKKEAGVIMGKAHEQAEVQKRDMLSKAKEEIGSLINEERQKMQQEKAQVLAEIKGDMADLVTSALEKILKKKVNNKTDKELIKKIIKK